MSRGLSLLRLRGLLVKEVLQIRRDPSSILLALVLPLLLLLLFGYGVSLNPQQVPIAVATDDHGPLSRDLLARFTLSPYFQVVPVAGLQQAQGLLETGEVDAFLHLQDNFSERFLQRGELALQLVVNGIDANRAQLINGYATGAIRLWQEQRRQRGETAATGGVRVLAQTRFNRSNESRYFLVPGLIVMIMTLTGALLTALVIAREWERGTMEATLATPLQAGELLLAKLFPYFILGMLGMLLTLAGGVGLFQVPLRGSLLLLIGLASLFMIVILGFGLAVSAAVRIQFVAAQIAVLAGFLPAIFLSGMIFDLESTPQAIQLVSHLFPARYFIQICHSLFLSGNIPSLLWPATLVLALMAVVVLLLARLKLSKQLK